VVKAGCAVEQYIGLHNDQHCHTGQCTAQVRFMRAIVLPDRMPYKLTIPNRYVNNQPGTGKIRPAFTVIGRMRDITAN